MSHHRWDQGCWRGAAAALWLVVAAFLPRSAAAEDASAPKTAPADAEIGFEVEVDAASDYVFRGIDQTNSRPSGQLDASVSWRALYVGAATSNVDYSPFGDPGYNQEADVYLGVKDEAFGFTYDVGVISYNYVHEGDELDYVEGYVRGSRQMGPVRVGAELYFDPDVTRRRRGPLYGEGQISWRVARKWTVEAAVGRGTGESAYTNWNFGVTYQLTRRVLLDLRYSDTDAHDLGGGYGARLIASAKLHFN